MKLENIIIIVDKIEYCQRGLKDLPEFNKRASEIHFYDYEHMNKILAIAIDYSDLPLWRRFGWCDLFWYKDNRCYKDYTYYSFEIFEALWNKGEFEI